MTDRAEHTPTGITNETGCIGLAELFSHSNDDDKRQLAREVLRLRERVGELEEALTDIRTELEQANGGKGPSLPLSAHVLGIARAALAKGDK